MSAWKGVRSTRDPEVWWLDVLPVEILLKIGSFLPDADRARLSITCTTLRFLRPTPRYGYRSSIHICAICNKKYTGFWGFYGKTNDEYCNRDCEWQRFFAPTVRLVWLTPTIYPRRYTYFDNPGTGRSDRRWERRWNRANTNDLFEERDVRRPSDGARK